MLDAQSEQKSIATFISEELPLKVPDSFSEGARFAFASLVSIKQGSLGDKSLILSLVQLAWPADSFVFDFHLDNALAVFL